MRRRQALVHYKHSSLIGANLARKVSLNKDYITVTRLDSTTPTVSNPFLYGQTKCGEMWNSVSF